MAIIHELQQNGSGLLIWSHAKQHLLKPADNLAIFHPYPFSVRPPSVYFLFTLLLCILLVFPLLGIRLAARRHLSLWCTHGAKDICRGSLPRCMQMSVCTIYERRLAIW